MSVTTATINSNPTARVWTGILEESLSTGEKLILVASIKKKEGLMPSQNKEDGNKLVLSGQDSFQEEPQEVGQKLLKNFAEEVGNNQSDSPLQRLSETIDAVTRQFSQAQLNIAVCLISKNLIYFLISGAGEVWLSREGELYRILDAEGKTLSGKIHDHDVYILGTTTFFNSIKQTNIKEFLKEDKTVQEAADNLRPITQSYRDPQAAAVIFETKEEISIQSPVPPQVTPAPAPTPAPANPTSPVPNDTLKSFLNSKLKNLALKLPEREMLVTYSPTSRKRTALGIGLVLLAILVVTIGFGLRQKGIHDYESTYSDRLQKAQELYEDSLLQKTANASGAKELFLQSEALVQTLLSEGIEDDQLKSLAENIKNSSGTVLGIVDAKTNTFLDLGLIREDVEAKEIVLHAERVAVLDIKGERIIFSNQEGKNADVVGGIDRTPSPKNITLYNDNFFVLVNEGILKVDLQGRAQNVLEADSEWGTVIKIGSFSGNIYILTTEGEIWRHPAITTGYGEKQKWLGADVTPDFSNAVDWAIDSSIWVLHSNGQVNKFTRGAQETFRVQNVEGGLDQTTAIYTDENLESIFILDKVQNRIVEIDKTGNYIKQYNSDGLQDVRDIVVTSSKILLLTDTKILEIPLK